MKNIWNLEKREINDLHRYKDNPRRISKKECDELEKSIQKFGICEPLVITKDGIIVGGHQRYNVLKRLGYTTVDVYVPVRDLSEEEIKELNLRLNKNQGKFDYDILANCFEIDMLLDVGFTEEELHIDTSIAEEEVEPETKSCTMTITFMDLAHLQECENSLGIIIDSYPGANYKIKAKK